MTAQSDEPGNHAPQGMAANGDILALRSTAVLLLAGLLLSGIIIAPFLAALVWSLALAVLSAPVEAQLRRSIRLPWLSTSLTLLLVVIVIVIPGFLVLQALLGELVRNSNLVDLLFSRSQWLQVVQRLPWLGAKLDAATFQLEWEALARSVSSHLTEWNEALLQGSISSLINLLLTFYFLFYLLRDRAALVSVLARAVPLGDAEFSLLSSRVRDAIFASVYGTITVAALQGALGSLIFWWLGLPSPVFWGVIMGLLAIVPFLGAFIVWVPVALGLAINGDLASALILTMWGLIVIGLIDNIVYPILVGRRIAMHSMLSFIAIVGGVVVFGPYGIVFGPICVTVTITLYQIWRSRLASIDASKLTASG